MMRKLVTVVESSGSAKEVMVVTVNEDERTKPLTNQQWR